MNTVMPDKLKHFYRQELFQAKLAFEQKLYPLSWRHLERAHVLGQPYPIEHSQVHWKMLVFGFRIKNRKEVFGQLPRLLVGGIKSFVGKIPVGNTGGASVPPLLPMEIPADLKQIISSAK